MEDYSLIRDTSMRVLLANLIFQMGVLESLFKCKLAGRTVCI
jgi:hypothetical protein